MKKALFLLTLLAAASSYAEVKENFCPYFTLNTLQAESSDLSNTKLKKDEAFKYMVKRYDGRISEWCKYKDRGSLKKLISSASEDAYSDCAKLKGTEAKDCHSLVSQYHEKTKIYEIAYQRGAADKNNALMNNCGAGVNDSSRDSIKEVSDGAEKSKKNSSAAAQ